MLRKKPSQELCVANFGLGSAKLGQMPANFGQLGADDQVLANSAQELCAFAPMLATLSRNRPNLG